MFSMSLKCTPRYTGKSRGKGNREEKGEEGKEKKEERKKRRKGRVIINGMEVRGT